MRFVMVGSRIQVVKGLRMNIETALKEAMTIDGALGVALVDWGSGMSLGTQGGGIGNFSPNLAIPRRPSPRDFPGCIRIGSGAMSASCRAAMRTAITAWGAKRC